MRAVTTVLRRVGLWRLVRRREAAEPNSADGKDENRSARTGALSDANVEEERLGQLSIRAAQFGRRYGGCQKPASSTATSCSNNDMPETSVKPEDAAAALTAATSHGAE
jgi:hypothetical protein